MIDDNRLNALIEGSESPETREEQILVYTYKKAIAGMIGVLVANEVTQKWGEMTTDDLEHFVFAYLVAELHRELEDDLCGTKPGSFH